jgi:predicted Zn-ribbon and HTH transcriptional regulator
MVGLRFINGYTELFSISRSYQRDGFYLAIAPFFCRKICGIFDKIFWYASY